MSADLLGIKQCSHVNDKYSLSNCPVCSGSGLYFDLVLTQVADFSTVNGINKLIQGVTHLLSSQEGQYSDYGYVDYGSRVKKFIGSKNLSETRAKFQILKDLQYYTAVKEQQNRLYNNITADEIIEDVVSIETVNTADEQTVKLQLRVGSTDQIQYFNVTQFKL